MWVQQAEEVRQAGEQRTPEEESCLGGEEEHRRGTQKVFRSLEVEHQGDLPGHPQIWYWSLEPLWEGRGLGELP